MYGAVIGAGISAAGSIIGGKKSSKALKQQQREIQRRREENRDWYNRRYNEDATARADAQRAITRAEEAIKRRNAAAAGTASVMGGSQEAVIAAQEANNKMLADISSQIAVAGEQRKDQIESEYRAREDSYAQQNMNLEAQRAQAVAQATQGLLGAAGNIASAWGTTTPKSGDMTGGTKNSEIINDDIFNAARSARGY